MTTVAAALADARDRIGAIAGLLLLAPREGFPAWGVPTETYPASAILTTSTIGPNGQPLRSRPAWVSPGTAANLADSWPVTVTVDSVDERGVTVAVGVLTPDRERGESAIQAIYDALYRPAKKEPETMANGITVVTSSGAWHLPNGTAWATRDTVIGELSVDIDGTGQGGEVQLASFSGVEAIFVDGEAVPIAIPALPPIAL